MDALNRDDLIALLRRRASCCVSLHLPTHRSGAATSQGPIRLTNLLRRVERDLRDRGDRPSDVRALLGPGTELVADQAFWQHQGDGLAVYLAPGWSTTIRLPMVVEELVVVSDRPVVSPLLRMLDGDHPYYVLALSEQHARLLEATRWRISEVPVPGMPSGVADALRYDLPQREKQYHVADRGGTAARTIRHAHGVGAEVQKERLVRYLRSVADALWPTLRDEHAPLVLAGVDHIRAAFRTVCPYDHIVDSGVAGNPDRSSAAELHRLSWELVAPLLQRERDAALEAYGDALGSGLADTDPDSVTEAAGTGRVASLFVRDDTARFEPAVAGTLCHDGSVFAMPPAEVPGHADIAALYRY
ncbi:hypothetical protein [Haloechinothrix sp. LS1_15]|uniref:baeRF3 domain-containing protein n=1 Tax=Haloechinothrix sp. LS1_15 TaxID=2652248 RepID=UPI002946F82B|nr:hypothetical protein [Haloechinothrix sp. LS1_15]MDV6014239.1 hypothetical protein [Haloechinothrix sp. LS1_15]